MAERQSSLFPNKKNRPKSNGMNDMKDFSSELEHKVIINNLEVQPIKKKIFNKNKSHKGIAGRKAAYSDPRLKKDQNSKLSISTKLRIQRLISRKFDGKSEGDIIDIALDHLVSSFDRDDRDSLYKAYKEDMAAAVPKIEQKNKHDKAKGLRTLEITEEVTKQTLQTQKENWVNGKFE